MWHVPQIIECSLTLYGHCTSEVINGGRNKVKLVRGLGDTVLKGVEYAVREPIRHGQDLSAGEDLS